MTGRKSVLASAFLVAVCAFCFRVGERDAHAIVPVPCPSGCDDVYAWWVKDALTGRQCFAVEFVGTAAGPLGGAGPTTHTTHGIPAIFSTAPTGGNKQNPSFTCERWTYPRYTETCGQVGGVWQSPQEVTPGGVGAFDVNITRKVCAP